MAREMSELLAGVMAAITMRLGGAMLEYEVRRSDDGVTITCPVYNLVCTLQDVPGGVLLQSHSARDGSWKIVLQPTHDLRMIVAHLLGTHK
jgi:hypothetical protein